MVGEPLHLVEVVGGEGVGGLGGGGTGTDTGAGQSEGENGSDWVHQILVWLQRVVLIVGWTLPQVGRTCNTDVGRRA
jgi:hypothetical protein